MMRPVRGAERLPCRKPLRKKPAAAGRGFARETSGVLPQVLDIDPAVVEFVDVADEPVLEVRRGDLDVKLQRQGVLAHRERLVRARCRRRQAFRAWRHLKGLSVPVQHLGRQVSQRARSASRRQRQGLPADLRRCHGSDTRAHGPRDQLCTKANAQCGQPTLDPVSNRRDHIPQEGEPSAVVDADRSTHDDEDFGIACARNRIAWRVEVVEGKV